MSLEDEYWGATMSLEDEYLELDDNLNYLQSRKQSIEIEIRRVKNEIEDVKQAILSAYEKDGECPVNLTVANVPPKPIISDEELIPERFIKVTKSVDKSAINKAIKEGEAVAGVTMSNGDITLRIKQRRK